MNQKIGFAIASTLLLSVVLSIPMAFAQPWEEVELNVQAETISTASTYFSFYVVASVAYPNTIIFTGGGQKFTVQLNPGDLVIVREYVDTKLTTSSDHVLYQGPASQVDLNGTEVIPEFPSFLILPLFMIATLLGAVILRRKLTS